MVQGLQYGIGGMYLRATGHDCGFVFGSFIFMLEKSEESTQKQRHISSLQNPPFPYWTPVYYIAEFLFFQCW